MAIIIDTNCFANVFNSRSSNHAEFKPVLDWIIKGKGIIVYGGSKYKEELQKASKYLTIFRLLKDVNKVLIGDSNEIDRVQSEIENKTVDKDFDDPHLPAIVIVTKCRLICSNDSRSIPFVQQRELYPQGCITPSYYTGLRNSNLLCDEYIDDTLKPLCKLNKKQRNLIENHL